VGFMLSRMAPKPSATSTHSCPSPSSPTWCTYRRRRTGDPAAAHRRRTRGQRFGRPCILRLERHQHRPVTPGRRVLGRPGCLAAPGPSRPSPLLVSFSVADRACAIEQALKLGASGCGDRPDVLHRLRRCRLRNQRNELAFGGELAAGGGDLAAAGVADGARHPASVDPANELSLHRLRGGVPPRARSGVERDDVDMDQVVEVLAETFREQVGTPRLVIDVADQGVLDGNPATRLRGEVAGRPPEPRRRASDC
jgi:hypothetical protein